jgi:hypothetical protein
MIYGNVRCGAQLQDIHKRLGSQSRKGEDGLERKLLSEVGNLDLLADGEGLDEEDWTLRYHMMTNF